MFTGLYLFLTCAGCICLGAYASAFLANRRGGARGKQSGAARAWAADHSREVLQEGSCECCGLLPFTERQAVWLSYQWDAEPARTNREWWCLYCIDTHFKRYSPGAYQERSGDAVRDSGGADSVPGVRAH